MTNPVLMVVDGNPSSLATLDGTLRRRYGHDYLIISEATPGTALGRLRELRAAGRPVAVVMAAAAIAELPAVDFLAQARSAQPAAKRVLVIPHGMIDAYLPAPGAGRDEGFHRAVSELNSANTCPVSHPPGRQADDPAGAARSAVARLWPELEDDVDRGLGDLPEPAEASVLGQLPYRCGACLCAERDPAGLGQRGRGALERGSRVAERGQRIGQVRCVVVVGVRFHDQDGAVGGEGLAGVGQRGGRVA